MERARTSECMHFVFHARLLALITNPKRCHIFIATASSNFGQTTRSATKGFGWTGRDVWGLMILCTYLWDFGQRLFADTFHIYCQGNSKVFATSRAHNTAQYQDKSNWCNKIFLHRNHRNVTFYLMVASLKKAELMLMPMLIE